MEIGRYESGSSGSMVDFFSSGRTRACLSCAGKTPIFKDRLIGAMYGASCSSNHVGTGSNSHDLADAFFSKHKISGTVAGLK